MASLCFYSTITLLLVGTLSPTTVKAEDGCTSLDFLVPVLLPDPIHLIENPKPLHIAFEPIILLEGELSEMEVAGTHGLKPFLALRLGNETVPHKLTLNATDQKLVIKIKYEATGHINVPEPLQPLFPFPSGDLVGKDYATITLTNLIVQILSNNVTLGDIGFPSRLDNVTRLNVEFEKLEIQFDYLLIGGEPAEWDKISNSVTNHWKPWWNLIEEPMTKVAENLINEFLQIIEVSAKEKEYRRLAGLDEMQCLEDTFPGAFPTEPPTCP